jgi:hypothetical protein
VSDIFVRIAIRLSLELAFQGGNSVFVLPKHTRNKLLAKGNPAKLRSLPNKAAATPSQRLYAPMYPG